MEEVIYPYRIINGKDGFKNMLNVYMYMPNTQVCVLSTLPVLSHLILLTITLQMGKPRHKEAK